MQLIRANERRWLPAGFPGIELCLLHGGEQGGGSVLLRFQAGARFPAHDHPGGEELLVVSGRIRLGEKHLQEGDYLWTPPGEIHDAQSEEGALLMVHSGAGVRVVEESAPRE